MTDNPKPEDKDLEATEVAQEQEQKEVKVVSDQESVSSAAEEPAPEAAEQQGPDGPDIDPDENKRLELFKGVSFQVTVELGRKLVTFGEVLNFGKGSVIELEKLADDPVDVYVNQSKIAEGEVVVVDDYFGVRITKLLETNSGN